MAAPTLDELKKEYKKITEANQEAYDKLNPPFGDDREMLKKNYLKALKKDDKAEIARLEPLYNAALDAYTKTQTRKNALKLQISSLEKAEERRKLKQATSKASVGTYEKSLKKLREAEIGIKGYKGQENYQNAYWAAQDAYDAVVAAGGTPPAALPSPKVVVGPRPEGENKGGTGGTTGTGPTGGVKIEDIGAIYNTLVDPANDGQLKALQSNLLKNFPQIYKAKADGLNSWVATQNAIQQIYTQRGQLPAALQGNNLMEFIAAPAVPNLFSASGSGAPEPYGTISNPLDAQATIERVFSNSGLNREPSKSEVTSLTKILNDAERKNLRLTKNGITTGGFNPDQFIENIIKTGTYTDPKTKKPITKGFITKINEEFKTKKQDVSNINAQDLMETARNNGITLSQSQLDAYTKSIQNGTKPEVIKNQIRSTAALGLPDNVKKLMAEGTDLATIYAPYKETMASVLEIEPTAINLNDQTLRNAIGPNGEMPIYDFQRALRKDARWQYTNNARKEVSDSVTKVLQDFGFQG
jgi:hypothetical protein